MSTAEAKPVSVSELNALFKSLDHLPAVMLAVSGGPDSTALMVLAARWAKSGKQRPKLIAATVDHGLRPEAKREALAVKRLARALGIEHRTLRWIGRKPATGLQEAARLARYRLLAGAARKAGAHAILTAHTLDDQAETVLIRLMRGSGITGLGAMRRTVTLPMHSRTPSPLEGEGWGGGSLQLSHLPPSRRATRVDLPLKGGGEKEGSALMLARPFLGIPKSRLLATLAAAEISFAEDPSNNDPRFTRVRIRSLMPALAQEGLTAERLTLLAERLRRADQALETTTDAASARLVRSRGHAFAMRAPEFSSLSEEVRLRLLGRTLGVVADSSVALRKLEALQQALHAAIAAKNPRFRRSLAGGMVTLSRDEIVVERAPPRRTRLEKLNHRRGGATRPRKKGLQ